MFSCLCNTWILGHLHEYEVNSQGTIGPVGVKYTFWDGERATSQQNLYSHEWPMHRHDPCFIRAYHANGFDPGGGSRPSSVDTPYPGRIAVNSLARQQGFDSCHDRTTVRITVFRTSVAWGATQLKNISIKSMSFESQLGFAVPHYLYPCCT